MGDVNTDAGKVIAGLSEADRTISGLTEDEAARRLAESGPNRIAAPREISFLRIAAEEVTEPMILLLLVVGAVYTLWGKLEDSLTIFIVIVLLVLAEVFNEYRAKKAISSLAKIAAPRARVVREGKMEEVRTETIVPGDILVLAQGTVVAADSKALVSYSLQVDESSLTGESFPQDKSEGDELYAGTIVVSGEGKAVAFATGRDTRLGKLSTAAREIKEPKTPLQLAMKSLALSLVWVALAFSIGIPLLGYLRGQPLKDMILTGLALAFAVIPEELPIIITMVLGLGAYQLSKENFLVKKLKAAEYTCHSMLVKHMRKCGNRSVNQEELDSIVWNEVVQLLKDPQLIEVEIARKVSESKNKGNNSVRQAKIENEIKQIRIAKDKLLDAYQATSCLTLEELRPRMEKIKKRVDELESELKDITALKEENERHLDVKATLEQLEKEIINII